MIIIIKKGDAYEEKIRRNVFETNSSMTHSLVICTEEDFKKWENGEMYYDRINECLVPATEVNMNEFEDDDDRMDSYLTSEEYDDCYEYFEEYSDNFTTPSGDKMVAFGYYGHD